MTGRRLTPQSKNKAPLSASKFRTPPHLNATLRENRTSATKFSRTGSKLLKSASHLDLVSLGNPQPNIRHNLTNIEAPYIDYEAECDLVCCDYLQSFLKQQIGKEAIQHHEKDILCQVSLQKDRIFRGKVKVQKSLQELKKLKTVKEVEKLVTCLSSNIERFSHFDEMYNLEDTLQQLLTLLNSVVNSVIVKNVKLIQEKEEFKKLEMVVEECSSAFGKMNLESRNAAELHSLTSVIKKYQQRVLSVSQKNKSLQSGKKNELFKMFKSISDMYATKQKNTG